MTPQEFIYDYNHWTSLTREYYIKLNKKQFMGRLSIEKDSNLKVAEKVISWCRERMISPDEWLFFLFIRYKWLRPPVFEVSWLCSNNLFQVYKGEHQFLDSDLQMFHIYRTSRKAKRIRGEL